MVLYLGLQYNGNQKSFANSTNLRLEHTPKQEWI